MKLGIIGRKVGVTQVFDDNGFLIPVTVIDTTDCMVSQVKTKDKEGYQAIQVAVGNRKPQNVNKATAGHFKKAGVPAKKMVKEFRLGINDDITVFKPGQALNVAMFEKNDRVDVIGISKGHGTTGVVQRFHYHGGDATHGVSDYFRHGGSNGSNTFPGRVLKLKGMPGQMGNIQTTTLGLKVIEVKTSENLILLLGAVPGHINAWVTIRPTNRKPAPTGRTFVK